MEMSLTYAESIHMLFLLAMLMALYGIYKETRKMND